MVRILIALLLVAASSVGVAQELFRYKDKDGRIVYSDIAPPADANNIQRKKLGGNFIETSETPYAVQVATQRNPVTLYAGDCGPGCDVARAMLNRRGVPFREVDVGQPGEALKMKEITGDMGIPVLLVGSAIILKGYEEAGWQAALDQAGYPKTPAARVNAIRNQADKNAAEKLAGKPASAAPAPKR